MSFVFTIHIRIESEIFYIIIPTPHIVYKQIYQTNMKEVIGIVYTFEKLF